ncbi:late control protein D [Mixta calida]|uniref:late control protein D n=1 Tax=Mixta calida TaxID=665913 RepID=UPI0034D58334
MVQQITDPEYLPAFSLSAEGNDITDVLRQNLAELTLTDHGGATGKSDELRITLISETLTLPAQGVRLRLGLGFNNNLTDKGWFVVCSASSSGPPRLVQIYATAAPMNARKQAGNVLSQKTRSWDNITLGDLVKTVAADNGLIPRVADSLAAIQIEHIDQTGESDANLLTRLARLYNAVSKPAGGYWLFLEQGAAQTVSGKPLAEITITPADVSSWTYSEGTRGSASGGSAATNGGESVAVRYFDESDGRTKTAETKHDGPAMVAPYTLSDKKQAVSQAQAKKTQTTRAQRKMTVSGACRPKMIGLTAEAPVITAGFGEREDGRWLAESLVFSLTSAGLSYSYSLVNDTRSATSKSKKTDSETNSGPVYFGTP